MVAHVILSLNNQSAEKRILETVEENSMVLKPYLLQRLREVGFEANVCDEHTVEIVMRVDHCEDRALSLTRAMDRYAQRQHAQWRKKRNNRPEAPPTSPRHISCTCSTAMDMSNFYWAIVDIEAVDFSFTPLPTGVIPVAIFKVPFIGLRHLVANHCALKSLTEQISILTRLETLDVSHNQLVTLPLSLGKMSSLRKIHVSRNKLVVLEQESICELKELAILDMSSNRLTTIPIDVLVTLPLLERLDLSLNRLREFPRKLGLSPTLRWLSLMGNTPCFETNELAVSTLPLGRNLVVAI